MSITSVTTESPPLEATPEQIRAVQQALEKLVNDPQAMRLARLQLILKIAETDLVVHEHFNEQIRSTLDLASSRNHEVF